MGVESFLVSATLEAVVAQRLIRKVCTKCRTYYEPSEEALMELELTPDQVVGKRFAFGKGCTDCHYTGYRGRTGIYEIMTVSERIRQLIMDNVPTSRIRDAALEEGMTTLRESGLLAIFDGITTIEEVVRETIATM
jgi:type IV pilus assembly protein PilB